MKILWIFYGGHHKIWPYLGSFLSILGSFLKVKEQNGGYFLEGAEIPNIFWGAWNSWYFFFLGGGENGRCWAQAYVWRNIESIPPGSQIICSKVFGCFHWLFLLLIINGGWHQNIYRGEFGGQSSSVTGWPSPFVQIQSPVHVHWFTLKEIL